MVYADMDSRILEQIEDHEVWLKTGGMRGEQLNLNDIDLDNYDLRGRNLSQSIIKNCSLVNADIRDANFTNANLKKSVLTRVRAFRADFSQANLSEVQAAHGKFNNSKLRLTNMKNFHGHDGVFTGADFTKANLTKANLNGAEFSKAGLIKTRLDGANLYNITLDYTHIDRISIIGTKGFALLSVCPMMPAPMYLLAQTFEDSDARYTEAYIHHTMRRMRKVIDDMLKYYGRNSAQYAVIKHLSEVKA